MDCNSHAEMPKICGSLEAGDKVASGEICGNCLAELVAYKNNYEIKTIHHDWATCIINLRKRIEQLEIMIRTSNELRESNGNRI